ncbi:MAG: hypothetical protein IKZ48_09380 [Prevotella sp.]|nr:hypothetical protein [Prevotella sp.]
MLNFLVIAMAATASFSLTSCGSDDDDDKGTSSGLTGWYIRQDLKGNVLDSWANSFDFTFNMQGEIIGKGKAWPWDGEEINMTEWSRDMVTTVYFIPDNETFIRYYAGYYRENAPAAGNKTLLYRFSYGSLGTLGLYAEHTYYYTYWREGNKLYTTEDGWTVYTITPSGLIPDGSSFAFSKFDPDEIY